MRERPFPRDNRRTVFSLLYVAIYMKHCNLLGLKQFVLTINVIVVENVYNVYDSE